MPEFDGDPASLPGNIRHIGDYLWDPTVPKNDAFECWVGRMRQENRTFVYVQHGRTFSEPSFWHVLVQCAANTRVALVASTDKMDVSVGSLPPNMFVSTSASQTHLLQLGSAVISSGTTTPVLGAIRAKKPCIVIPTGGEQFDLAERCSALNIGYTIPAAHLTESTLTEALETILYNTCIHDNVRGLASLFEDLDAEERGASSLIALAGGALSITHTLRGY